MTRRAKPGPSRATCDHCGVEMIASGLRTHDRVCTLARVTRVTDFQLAVWRAFQEATEAQPGAPVTVEAVRARELHGYDRPLLEVYIEALRALDGLGLVILTAAGKHTGWARRLGDTEGTPEQREAVVRLRRLVAP